MIDRLKPAAVCVPTRSGSIITFVPMLTTEAKAYRVALRYLHKAIKDRKHDKTTQEMIFNEFEAFFKEKGYENIYLKNNNDNIIENGHLRHYRRFAIY